MNSSDLLDPAETGGATLPRRITGPPIFFMHIAKTAGSYLNKVLDDALAPGQVVTHVEHRLGNSEDLADIMASGTKVISGHVMNSLWEDIAAPFDRSFRKVTILRDPIGHLASHLLWLDHYNLPRMRKAYAALDEAHQRIVDRIAAVDLSDIGQLDRYLTHLGPTELRLFDNCQSRYFIAKGRQDPDCYRALSLSDARQVRMSASQFDLILRQDTLEADIARLSDLVHVPLKPLEERVNARRSGRTIDIENPFVRQVLSKRTLLDQWLWRWAGEAR